MFYITSKKKSYLHTLSHTHTHNTHEITVSSNDLKENGTTSQRQGNPWLDRQKEYGIDFPLVRLLPSPIPGTEGKGMREGGRRRKKKHERQSADKWNR